LEHFPVLCTGECHISPAVLASMWREEETKCKNLEDKMKSMLKGRGVCWANIFTNNLIEYATFFGWVLFIHSIKQIISFQSLKLLLA